MMQLIPLYLAGPSVFYPNSAEHSVKLKALARIYGFNGHYPLDGNFNPTGRPDLTQEEARILIKRSNVKLVAKKTKATLADYSPFRGHAMDTGTAYEIAYSEALGHPVAGYTGDPSEYIARVKHDTKVRKTKAGSFDEQGYLIEDFGLIDNIMVCAEIEIFDNPRAALAHLACITRKIRTKNRPKSFYDRVENVVIEKRNGAFRVTGETSGLPTRAIGRAKHALLAEIIGGFWQDPAFDAALPAG
jgi:nucleoside 2-deoxyribosyltransferase